MNSSINNSKGLNREIEHLNVHEFLLRETKPVERHPIARLELSWSNIGIFLRTEIESLYVANQVPVDRPTEEFAVRERLKERLEKMLSTAFFTIREIPYSKDEKLKRLDLVLSQDKTAKNILVAIELKSDRADVPELLEDWRKLDKYASATRRISIYAGFASRTRLANIKQNISKALKDTEFSKVKEVAKQEWQVPHIQDKADGSSRSCFIYIWSISTPKPNMNFDIYETDEG